MCTDIDLSKTTPATGLFHKGNEPEAMAIKIDVALCMCGRVNWAKVQGNHVWVLAEPVPDQKALDRMVENDIEFSKESQAD